MLPSDGIKEAATKEPQMTHKCYSLITEISEVTWSRIPYLPIQIRICRMNVSRLQIFQELNGK